MVARSKQLDHSRRNFFQSALVEKQGVQWVWKSHYHIEELLLVAFEVWSGWTHNEELYCLGTWIQWVQSCIQFFCELEGNELASRKGILYPIYEFLYFQTGTSHRSFELSEVYWWGILEDQRWKDHTITHCQKFRSPIWWVFNIWETSRHDCKNL